MPVLAAEINLPAHYHRYPPETEAKALPSFPAIERDLSLIVRESVAWQEIHACVAGLQLQHREAIEFITTFRGKQIEPGHKSITLRLRFRAADTTLKHADVDEQMQSVMAALTQRFNATLRTA